MDSLTLIIFGRPKKRYTVIHQTKCRAVEWDVMYIKNKYIYIFIKSSARNALTPTNPSVFCSAQVAQEVEVLPPAA